MDIARDKIERLIFIRYLLRQAEYHKTKGRPLSSFSLLIMHDLVECFLQVCMETLLPEEKKDKNSILQTMSDKINNQLIKLEVNQTINNSFIKTLNELRNQLKHSTIFIDQKNIDNLYSQCDVFLTDFTKIIFDLDLNQVSLTLLIKNKNVRDYLENSQIERDKKEYGNAMISIGKAFIELEYSELIVLDDDGYNILRKEKSPSFIAHARMSGNSPDRATSQIIGYLEKDITKIYEKIFDLQKILSYGIDYRMFLNFKSILPEMYFTTNPIGIVFVTPSENEIIRKNYTEEKVKFCFDFVLDLTLQMEK